jgi:hypothetical protein
MVGLTEPEPINFRTKLLLISYLASGLIALAMVLWFVVVMLIYLVSGEKAVQSLPVGFLFPWLPIAVLVMLMGKLALQWSLRKARRSGTR